MLGVFESIKELIETGCSDLKEEQINIGPYDAREQYKLACYPVIIIGDLNPAGAKIETTQFEDYKNVITVSCEHQKDGLAYELALKIKDLLSGACNGAVKHMSPESITGTKNSDGVYVYAVNFIIDI